VREELFLLDNPAPIFSSKQRIGRGYFTSTNAPLALLRVRCVRWCGACRVVALFLTFVSSRLSVASGFGDVYTGKDKTTNQVVRPTSPARVGLNPAV
jgi:hypothetical protein